MSPSCNRLILAELLERLCRQAPDRQLFGEILDGIAQEIDCERAFFFLLRPRGGFRVLVARSRDQENLQQPALRMSHFAVHRMAESESMVLVADARRDRRYRTEDVLDGKKGPHSILVLPLHVEGGLEGGVYADHRFRSLELSSTGQDALREWMGVLGLALRLRKALQQKPGAHSSIPAELPARAPHRDRAALVSAEDQGEVEGFHGLISANPDMRDLFEMARSLGNSTLPVIIRGETGTGKTMLARALHESSARAEGPFFAVDPAAIPEELIESELLGHVKGAFTGADSDRKGALALADGGTLLLDDVANMSEEFQKKLLRVLEDGQVRPLGAKVPLRADVRLVSITSQTLEPLVRKGTFRRDLYYRLKGVVFDIPPIRDRHEDILPLAIRLLESHAKKEGRPPPVLETSAQARLLTYDWPGNVREIENEMRRLVALGATSIDATRLAPFLRERGGGRRGTADGGAQAEMTVGLEETVEKAEKDAIQVALRLAGGNKSRAATALGITRKTLYRRMEKYGLEK